ncbi:MAG: hypothetical protein CMA43_00905 [Euryarchaeota archaeon]|nr:hypothetical protein [Euryarchaeota archaeon]|tara:strand:+ start:223 stop:621 length:399 start_codon:yes stop_codon:yes gene_type:complete
MKLSDIELPSNKKFGFFFTIFFMILAGYFYINGSFSLVIAFSITALIFIVITIFRAHYLLPLNKIWMSFGLLLGMIISPIVLGIIFFGLISPIALLMRFFGRDELHLKFQNKSSHWISRAEPIQSDSFKNQF